MTAQEVVLQIRYNDCTVFCDHYNNPACPECRWQVAIDALEKQVPFKPTTDKLLAGVGRCKCGVEFLDKKTAYCGNCGQAIDWEVADGYKTDNTQASE